MTTTTIVLTVLTAAAFPLLLWAIGRTVTAIASQAPPARGRPHQYLAGRLDAVQITTVVTGQDELLITLTTQATSNTQGTRDPLTGVFHVTATTCPLVRVRRWHDENTPLRAYLSHDGAIMLADPALGGNAPCEPPTTITWLTHKPPITQNQPPPENK